MTVASDAKRILATKILIFPWASNGDGIVSNIGTIVGVTGIILAVHFIPDETDAPTEGYDVQILTVGGMDVLMGVGANLPQSPASTNNSRTPLNTDDQMVAIYNQDLTIAVTNAGAFKKGTVFLFISE